MPEPADRSSEPFQDPRHLPDLDRSRGDRPGRTLALAAVPLLVVHAALLATWDLASRLSFSLGLLALGFLALVWAVRRLERHERGSGWLASAGPLLLVAAVLRLLLLPLPPTLSDDLLRYVWDGRVVAAGFDPYSLPPEAEELAPLRDERWERMPHREVPTVYPPLAMGLFSIAAATLWPLYATKLLVTALDVAGCALLFAVARRRGLPTTRVLWYAWNPLVVLETAGMGHVDAAGGAAAVAAVLWLLAPPGRLSRSRLAERLGAAAPAAAAAAGALVKLVPAAAIPMWARQSGRPLAFLLAAGLLVGAATVPVVLATGGVPPGLVAYGVSWEFNGPLYEPLWRLLDAVDADGWAARQVGDLEERTGEWERHDWIYPYLYPQMLAKLLLAVGLAVVFLRSLGERDPVTGTGRLFGNLLLFSATFYPWYLVWVLPWAALARHRAWIVLSATLLLSYVGQRPEVAYFPWVFLAVWLPFWLLVLVDEGRSRWSTD